MRYVGNNFTFINYMVLAYIILEVISILLYIPRMRFWFEGFKPQKRLKNDKQNKFAIIIPARDESKVIKRLFDSIKTQTYPTNMFDIHVIVDRNDDPTIEIAKSYFSNLKTYVVENQTRKAEALDVCMQQILASGVKYDDFIIVDADDMLTPNFFEEMNNGLATGAEIVMPRKRILNWETKNKKYRNVIANTSALTYVGLDAMGNKGKTKRNYSLSLCGQGLLISYKIVEGLGGYPFRSLIEDYEILVECIRKGYSQTYYEYAEIYAEEPTKKKDYDNRRVRWIKGYAQFNQMYGKEVRATLHKDGKFDKTNFQFLFGFLPVAFIFGVNVIFFLMGLVTTIVYLIMAKKVLMFFALGFTVSIFAIIYLELFIYGILSMLSDRDICKRTVKEDIILALVNPFIQMDYIWIFILAFTTNVPVEWEKIDRNNIIN